MTDRKWKSFDWSEREHGYDWANRHDANQW